MNPIQVIILASIGVGVFVGVTMLVYKRVTRKSAQAFYFDRQRNVSFITGNSYSGLVTHPDGGYVERENAAISMRSGRPFSEAGQVGWRRPTQPVFLVRTGDSAPLKIENDGQLRVENLSDSEYEDRLDLAAELADADAAKKATGPDMLLLTLGAAVIILALATGVVATVAVTQGAFE